MSLPTVVRQRVCWIVFLVTVLGVTEYAESGLLRRRCRPWRCFRAVCRPVCPATCARPIEAPSAAQPVESDGCVNRICCEQLLAEFWWGPMCMYATYLAERCGEGSVIYEGPCGASLLGDCTWDCEDCVNGGGFPPIPLPPDVPEAKQRLPRYVHRDLAANGLGGRVTEPRPGPGYAFEQWKEEDGVSRRGAVIDMPLQFNADHTPDWSSEKRRVHLDWIQSGNATPRKESGVGYETDEPPHGAAEILWMDKVGTYIYSLKVKFRGRERHYVVLLSGAK